MIRLICSESLRSISAIIASMDFTASSEINVDAERAWRASVATASCTALRASEVLGLNSLLRRVSNSDASTVPAFAARWVRFESAMMIEQVGLRGGFGLRRDSLEQGGVFQKFGD